MWDLLCFVDPSNSWDGDDVTMDVRFEAPDSNMDSIGSQFTLPLPLSVNDIIFERSLSPARFTSAAVRRRCGRGLKRATARRTRYQRLRPAAIFRCYKRRMPTP